MERQSRWENISFIDERVKTSMRLPASCVLWRSQTHISHSEVIGIEREPIPQIKHSKAGRDGKRVEEVGVLTHQPQISPTGL